MNKEVSNANGHLTDATFCSPSGYRGIKLSRGVNLGGLTHLHHLKGEGTIVIEELLEKYICPKNRKASKILCYIRPITRTLYEGNLSYLYATLMLVYIVLYTIYV